MFYVYGNFFIQITHLAYIDVDLYSECTLPIDNILYHWSAKVIRAVHLTSGLCLIYRLQVICII
jgi:hypothetical protein